MNSQRTVALLAVALLTGPVAAHAVTLQINGIGILTGATDVDVDGTLYDVQFLDGSCISLFDGCDNATDDFAFTTNADALVAAQARLGPRTRHARAPRPGPAWSRLDEAQSELRVWTWVG